MSSDEAPDCPLCMETLELDDLNFYPCKCEYQICRFCWHRIRTDENGLCPACRAPYPEDPVNFKPLSTEELLRIRSEKKAKAAQARHKVSEGRKHLANLRVIQESLVYVMGLAPRIADNDVLRRPEYFGKFGRIVKVAVSPPASASQSSYTAYVTYARPEEALRAIQAVNNVSVEGRTVKASLGTTKYCSAYLRNQPCHKTDCMYLHDLANPLASFTKEDMGQGKHTDYERRLHEAMLTSSQRAEAQAQATPAPTPQPLLPPPSQTPAQPSRPAPSSAEPAASAKAANGHAQKTPPPSASSSKGGASSSTSQPTPSSKSSNKAKAKAAKAAAAAAAAAAASNGVGDKEKEAEKDKEREKERGAEAEKEKGAERPYPRVRDVGPEASQGEEDDMSRILAAISAQASSRTASVYTTADTDAFSSLVNPPSQPKSAEKAASLDLDTVGPPPGIFTDVPGRPAPPPLGTDWQAAFGLKPSPAQAQPSSSAAKAEPCGLSGLGPTEEAGEEAADAHPHLPASLFDDDALGFDPFSESSKGLADLMAEEERERQRTSSLSHQRPRPPPHGSQAQGSIPRPNGFPAPSRLGTSWGSGHGSGQGQGSAGSSLGSLSSLGHPFSGHSRSSVVSPNTLIGSLAGKGPPPPLKPGSLPKSDTASPGPGPFTSPPPGFPPMPQHSSGHYDGPSPNTHFPPNGMRFPGPPPGFGPGPGPGAFREASPSQPPHRFPHGPPHPPSSAAQDSFNMQEWQDGLKSLLPNVNVHFAPSLGGGGGKGGGWSGGPPGGPPPFSRPPPQLSVSTNSGHMGGAGNGSMRPSPPDHHGPGPFRMPPPLNGPPPPHNGPPPLNRPPPPPGFPQPPGSGGWHCLTPPPPGFSPRQH